MAIVLAEALHGGQSVRQIVAHLRNEQVVPLDLLEKKRIERLLPLDWYLVFILLRWDVLGSLEKYLVQLGSKVLIDHLVTPILLYLCQGRLLRPLDHELVNVGAMHDL